MKLMAAGAWLHSFIRGLCREPPSAHQEIAFVGDGLIPPVAESQAAFAVPLQPITMHVCSVQLEQSEK